MTHAIFSCSGLTVRRRAEPDAPPILRELDLAVGAGECVALCGPSGSGKTTACLAPFRLTGRNLAVEGTATVTGESAWSRVGQVTTGGVAFVFQEPLGNFSPHLKIKLQLHDLNKKPNLEILAEWAAELGLDEFPRLLEQFPGQCSGGELQRLALLAALAQDPALLVADEPTAALDAGGRTAWSELVRRQMGLGLAVLLVTHDETLLQLLDSRRVGLAPVDTPSSVHSSKPATTNLSPQAALLAVRLTPGSRAPTGRVVVDGKFRDVNAGDGGGFSLAAGQCLALVGPSGGGKSSVLNLVLGLPSPVQGEVIWDGTRLGPWPSGNRRAVAGQMAAVLQDARSGLNPHRRIEDSVAAAFRKAGHSWRACRQLAAAELAALGVPVEAWQRRPSTLSVGQAQRVALAIAMAVRPALVVCDEPTSAQDAAHRALVIRRLLDARDRQGCAVLLATHDLELAQALDAPRLRVGPSGADAG